MKERAAPATEIEAATFVTKRANMALSRAQTYGGQRTFSVELHLLQIGPAVLAGIEGEPFAEIGLEIKARSPWSRPGLVVTPEAGPATSPLRRLSPGWVRGRHLALRSGGGRAGGGANSCRPRGSARAHQTGRGGNEQCRRG